MNNCGSHLVPVLLNFLIVILQCSLQSDDGNTEPFTRRHDTQHNDIQRKGLICDIEHNDTQHNDTQHKDTQHNDTHHNYAIMLNVIELSVMIYLLVC